MFAAHIALILPDGTLNRAMMPWHGIGSALRALPSVEPSALHVMQENELAQTQRLWLLASAATPATSAPNP
jgi:hypothetical protein